jgi:hypothetical protein
MTRTSKLNDLQLILLATALQRDDGSLLPFPERFLDEEERVRKAIPLLLRRQLIEEAPVGDQSRTWREEDDQRIGLVITSTGRTIIAAEEPETGPAGGEESDPAQPQSNSIATPREGSKSELVLNLLRRTDGATLPELVEATGWQPHTTRAALTGLRKKGHSIEKSKRDEATCYRIAEAA